MNFLAHAHLSGANKELMIGNFIADSVKGKKHKDYPKGIENGIILHRKIDTYTDNEIVKKSMSVIRNDYGKFSGIIIDIYYDHFLAARWNDYSNEDLKVYTQKVYALLKRNFFILPARSQRILPFMISQNWLHGYANTQELKKVFYGMDRRTSNISGMRKAVDQLVENYEELELHFKEFYPQLQLYVANEIQENGF
jgi:acyl carrier protein phosphodiesterase